MSFPCKDCIISMTCMKICYRIITFPDLVMLEKFKKLKRCFDCGHQFFEVYTPIKNDNDYENRFSKNKFYGHYYLKCPNCRTVFYIEIEHWKGEFRKETYSMFRIGKIEIDKNLDEGKNWWSNKSLAKDYNQSVIMRGNAIVKAIKFGFERK